MQVIEAPIQDLLNQLKHQGIQVWIDSDKLKINAPKGRMTPALQTTLTERKPEILAYLNQAASSPACLAQAKSGGKLGIGIETIGRLISGWRAGHFTPPAVNPQTMAQQLQVTCRPLPSDYNNPTILNFQQELIDQLKAWGVTVLDWQTATREYTYELKIPFTPWKRQIRTRIINASTSAVIDVERQPQTLLAKAKLWLAEQFYQFYRWWHPGKDLSVAKIAQLMGWAEANILPLEDPSNTQVIVLTDLNPEFVSDSIPYRQKIPIGVATLVRNFAEIVIGVSDQKLSILNMNLSDSVYPRTGLAEFVLQSLIPKIYVPILPLPLSRFEMGRFQPEQSTAAQELVQLGQGLATTGLLPEGFKIDDVIQRQSHRDIVDWLANGRTGVSYGFVAYLEPPQYVGPVEISASEWQTLEPVAGFPATELRQNSQGRRYLRFEFGGELGGQAKFHQLPDIWLVSSRSGANKTNLNLKTDLLRVGLQDRLLLQLPEGLDASTQQIKPSYDTFVMVAVALAAALFAPELIANGAPLVHFHGYPAATWFQPQEDYSGIANPSVPCGTFESGVFNFIGIADLAVKHSASLELVALIEPDHGTNILARSCSQLLARLQQGLASQQLELGGKHAASLKASAGREA